MSPKRKIIPYNRKLTAVARMLRNNSTLGEVLLWNQLKGRKMRGYQFLRQKPLDQYIVDFFCYDLKLAIEVDGDSHASKCEEDILRQQKLERLGIRFLRFRDIDVKQNMVAILQKIDAWIENYDSHDTHSNVRQS